MRKWKDYKETINLSEDIFALARSGNIQRLQEFLERDCTTRWNISVLSMPGHCGLAPMASTQRYGPLVPRYPDDE